LAIFWAGLASNDTLSGHRQLIRSTLLRNRPSREIFISIACAISAFGYSVGFRILDITHVRWLYVGDSAQAYLGWEFFRRTPLLQFPLGVNPEFGKGFDSSVVFSDSIPLIAVILKPVSRIIDAPVQYFGWWLLLAFVAQAILSIKILSLLGVPSPARLVALPILLLQPVLLDRMSFEGYGHMGLSAHWLILLGIWMYLRPHTRHWEWTVALLVAIGVTFYYFIILGIFFLGWVVVDVLGHSSKRRALQRHVSRSFAILVTSVVFTGLLGGFTSGGLGDTGLGTYRATLASVFDAATLNGPRWTLLSFLPDIPNPPGSQEGFGFLGVAGFILLALAAIQVSVWVPRLASLRAMVLIGIAGLFVVLALSPRIALGPREIASYTWPKVIEEALSVVRASGRLIWIPIYLSSFASISIITAKREWKSNIAVSLVALVSLVHVADTTHAVASVRSRFTETEDALITDGPRWDAWAAGKKHLVSIPPLSNDPRWIDLAVFANRHQLTTTAAYVSRKDEFSFAQLANDSQRLLERRDFSSDTLYVITNYPPNPESVRLLAEARGSKASPYRVFQVEELTVVVP
jgi:hypothetical protein